MGKVWCRCLILVLIGFSNSLASAQSTFHWVSTNGPVADGPNVLVVNSNGDIIAGKGKVLYRSTDLGVDWQRFPFPNYLGSVGQIIALPNGHLLAVADHGVVVRLNPDGSSPKIVEAHNVGTLQSNRRGVVFQQLNGSTYLRSRDEGVSWDTIHGPVGETIDGFSSDELRYYLSTQTGVYTSSDEGQNWRRALNGIPVGGYWQIQAGNSGYVWALFYESSGSYGLTYSTDYGQSWKFGYAVDLHGNMFPNRNNEIILQNSFRYFKDTGSVLPPLQGYNGVVVCDSNGRWIVAANASPNLYYSSEGYPQSWRPLAALPFTSFPTLMRAFSGVMVGDGNSESLFQPSLGWRKLAWKGSTPLGMDFNNNYLLGTTGNDLTRSTDSGRTWKNIFPNVPSGQMHATTAPPALIYAATNGIFLTLNEGKVWNDVSDDNLHGPVSMLAADSVGTLYVASGDKLDVSTDAGASWKKISLPRATTIMNLETNRAGTVAFSGQDGRVFRSFDKGLTWESTASPDTTNIVSFKLSPTDAIFASSAGGAFYWAEGKSGPVTANNGLDSLSVLSFSVDGAGVVYAATNGGGVYQSAGDLGSLQVSRMGSVPSLTVFPNPASKTIYVTAPTSAEWTVNIYDELGRLKLVESQIGNTIDCDVRSLPAGIYELVIHSNTTQYISKFQIAR